MGSRSHFAGLRCREFPVTLYPQVEPCFYPEKQQEMLGCLLFLVLFGTLLPSAQAYSRSGVPRIGRPPASIGCMLALTVVATVVVWFLPPMWCGIIWSGRLVRSALGGGAG